MISARVTWGLGGLVAGVAGILGSEGAAAYLGRRLTPFDAMAELVIELTPGSVSHFVIERFGSGDKALLAAILWVVLVGLFWWAGGLAARAWWAPAPLYAVMGGLALTAVLTREDAVAEDTIPVALGVVTWIVALSFVTDRLGRLAASGVPLESDEAAQTRRAVLLRAGATITLGAAVALAGPRLGSGRRRVQQARRLLNLPATMPRRPAGVTADPRIAPWMTPNPDFYRVDTAFQAPAVHPEDWQLRIHGLVDRELVLGYQDLLDREVTEDWITLNCVSNPVGGDLIGNAWWSGVRLASLLQEAGVQAGADAVLQTSWDGWTCGTPLRALTDDRNAMIAFAMNGEPLPIEHGFPARTVVPGLYGYVSACKWVVDIEVTRFDRIEAYWTGLGWAEQAPLRISSRIDVPREGEEVAAGPVRIGGVAWAQHTGIAAVEYAVDGGPWLPAALGRIGEHADGSENLDTWVQWSATVPLAQGEHEVRVRAIDRDGEEQTGVVRDVRPDGATGWHSRTITVG